MYPEAQKKIIKIHFDLGKCQSMPDKDLFQEEYLISTKESLQENHSKSNPPLLVNFIQQI